MKPENGQVFAQWEYKHLKKYGKSTGKFNLECGRASKTGPGKFIFVTNEGRKIFNNIHGNIQTLGSKKDESDTAGAQSPIKPSPPSNSGMKLPKKSHEAPAAIGKSSIPEYAVVDKSKKKKKRSSLMVQSSQDKDVATTTGVKDGVFRKLENVYDTPILDSIKPKQQPAEQKPADAPGYSLPTFFNSAPTKTVTNASPLGQQPQQVMDTPFDNEDPFSGYSVPMFNPEPSTQQPEKVKQSGKNPFFEDPSYDTPILPDDQPPMEWMESKLVQPMTKSETMVTGDYDVPPQPDDELVAFSNNPFLNGSNTHTSPLSKKQDYVNDVNHTATSYSSSKDGTTTTTALSFESDEEDEGAVMNPLLNIEDFAKYLDVDGNDDMWADLAKQKFN